MSAAAYNALTELSALGGRPVVEAKGVDEEEEARCTCRGRC